MAKRKRKQKTVIAKVKAKTFYPMAFCINENIPIAVSHIKVGKKVKVNWVHFKEKFAEFRKKYEFSLENCKKGDKVHCPVCGGLVDFRLWMSDTIPHIVEFKKGEGDVRVSQEKTK